MTAKPRVLLIGGQFTGNFCARELKSKFHVTVVDAKEYFEYTPGVLRAFVKPAHLDALTFTLQPVPIQKLLRIAFNSQLFYSTYNFFRMKCMDAFFTELWCWPMQLVVQCNMTLCPNISIDTRSVVQQFAYSVVRVFGCVFGSVQHFNCDSWPLCPWSHELQRLLVCKSLSAMKFGLCFAISGNCSKPIHLMI